MNLSRRRLLHLAGAAGALAATPCRVRAEAYPGRPLRWVVGFPPGGRVDIVSRIVAPWLAERLGPPGGVGNKPGEDSHTTIQNRVDSPPAGRRTATRSSSSPPPPPSTSRCSTNFPLTCCATSRRSPG